ncbi:nuclear transport factor 2 family protein [Aquimarina sp. 2201CG5-10]|uniref:nuclear transport factor 2 family protein n=1 Tax=Aquimarina callyspongiae TaxID=3098150 RepID=UPI002AB36369|nr:nuclear transport factor 2 family protein [Aquimarina sp. 2201CG5-10]MDY8135434.1 nuclear transport factor 2 family protein [Aquimarina sp. 2201CG5-10]
MKRLRLIIIFVLITCLESFAQNKGELYDTILKLDSTFFKALNECDLEKYESFLAFDYEFYHDKQGLTVSKTSEIKSMSLFCGEQRKRQQIKRVLIKESLEVYPIANYGAIENGEHIFHLVIDDNTSKPISKAKFTSIWRFDNNEWKLARTISYNHIPYGKIQLDDKILKLYEGDYQATDRIVNIKIDKETLKMTDLVDEKAVWSAEMLSESQNTFYLNQNNIQIKFIQKKGKVEKLAVYENGKLIEEIKKIK